MALSIIAGIPSSLIRLNKGFVPTAPGWSIEVVPAGKRADLSTCWRQVLALADGSSIDGTHILAYHKPEKERGFYEDAVYSRHRLIWLQPSDLRAYGRSEFSESIRKLLDFESNWRKRIRPAAVASPLILPETAFDAELDVERLWYRGQWVQIGYDELESVCRLSERFNMLHHDDDCWIDRGGRRFVYTGQRHGEHVEQSRLWKYTFRIPDGFHFDVGRPDRRGPFFIRDRDGTSYKVTRHTNIDCHGHILS